MSIKFSFFADSAKTTRTASFLTGSTGYFDGTVSVVAAISGATFSIPLKNASEVLQSTPLNLTGVTLSTNTPTAFSALNSSNTPSFSVPDTPGEYFILPFLSNTGLQSEATPELWFTATASATPGVVINGGTLSAYSVTSTQDVSVTGSTTVAADVYFVQLTSGSTQYAFNIPSTSATTFVGSIDLGDIEPGTWSVLYSAAKDGSGDTYADPTDLVVLAPSPLGYMNTLKTQIHSALSTEFGADWTYYKDGIPRHDAPTLPSIIIRISNPPTDEYMFGLERVKNVAFDIIALIPEGKEDADGNIDEQYAANVFERIEEVLRTKTSWGGLSITETELVGSIHQEKMDSYMVFEVITSFKIGVKITDG